MYNNKYCFNEFKNVEKNADKSLTARYDNNWVRFYWLKKFLEFAPRTAKIKTKNKFVYNNAAKLLNILLSIYFNDYNNTTNEEKEKMGEIYHPDNLFIKGYRFIELKKLN